MLLMNKYVSGICEGDEVKFSSEIVPRGLGMRAGEADDDDVSLL